MNSFNVSILITRFGQHGSDTLFKVQEKSSKILVISI